MVSGLRRGSGALALSPALHPLHSLSAASLGAEPSHALLTAAVGGTSGAGLGAAEAHPCASHASRWSSWPLWPRRVPHRQVEGRAGAWSELPGPGVGGPATPG